MTFRAHSKTEYKRMVAQGANVLPPDDSLTERVKVDGSLAAVTDAIRVNVTAINVEAMKQEIVR